MHCPTSHQPGSFFGEQALLTKSKRNATIKASPKEKTVCLYMGRQQFEELLGPLATLMHAVNAKREALRRQQNSSQKLRRKMMHLERMMNPQLAVELEVQKLADEMGVSNSAAGMCLCVGLWAFGFGSGVGSCQLPVAVCCLPLPFFIWHWPFTIW